MNNCNVCGLPLELCVCETIAKESTQKIKVFLEKKSFGKYYTIIDGIDPKSVSLKDLIKNLKNKFACGGAVKNNRLELQGDHRKHFPKILEEQGFARESIEIR